MRCAYYDLMDSTTGATPGRQSNYSSLDHLHGAGLVGIRRRGGPSSPGAPNPWWGFAGEGDRHRLEHRRVVGSTPALAPCRDLGQVLYLQLPVRFGVKS